MKSLPFRIKPYKAADRPHLKFVVVGRINGAVRKFFFTTITDAKTKAHLLNRQSVEHGAEAAAVSTELRLMALDCQEQLRPLGKTIQEVTKEALEKYAENNKSCSIESLFEQVILSKVAIASKGYVCSLRRIGKRLTEMFPNRLASEFSSKDIESFLTKRNAGNSVATRNNDRTLLYMVFEFARVHGYCRVNAVSRIAKMKELEKEVGMLDPSAQLARLLAAAPPTILPASAICAFAGLRNREVCRLDWSHIDLDTDDPDYPYGCIEVPARVAKARRRRPVKIEACLAAWLRPFAKRSGRVCNMDDKYLCQVRKKVAEKVGIVDWPRNAHRHGFASCHIARHKNAAELSYELGHRGTDLIFSHYRKVVRPKTANDYFSLFPFSRPELSKVYAFTAEAYPWHCSVGRVLDGEWIDGVRSLAHYFGVQRTIPYHWFNEVPGCPPRPTDDRFHLPTWREFVKTYNRRKTGRDFESSLLFYVESFEACGRENREYFETEREASEVARARNQSRLAKELNLEEIANVIEFPSGDIVRSQTQPQSTETASSAG